MKSPRSPESIRPEKLVLFDPEKGDQSLTGLGLLKRNEDGSLCAVYSPGEISVTFEIGRDPDLENPSERNRTFNRIGLLVGRIRVARQIAAELKGDIAEILSQIRSGFSEEVVISDSKSSVKPSIEEQEIMVELRRLGIKEVQFQ